jgi:uroporphyrinogen decarboxylase
MTAYERLMGVFNGKPVDRVPVAPIVREWCARQAGFTFSGLMNSATKQVAAQYYCAKTFGTDALWDLWGIHAEAEAMGSVLKIPDDERCYVDIPAIRDYDKDLPKIKPLNPHKDAHLPLILEGIRQLKDVAAGRYPVLGYVNAPFRLASMLRGAETMLNDCKGADGHLEDFLVMCTDALIVYGRAVIQAGADIVWVSDPTSSGDKVSRDLWLTYGFPHTKRLVTALKENGVKVFMHMCGNTNDRLDTFVEMGVDAMSLSEKVDMAQARRIMGDDIILWGNVDLKNTTVFPTPEQIEAEAEACIERGMGKKGNFVLSSGCMTRADVPPQNIRAMVNASHKYGRYS